jgi:putative transposase
MKATPEHVIYFKKSCGVSRFSFNWGLAEWNNQFKEGKKPNWMALKKQLNSIKEKQFPWMYEVTKCAPEGALARILRIEPKLRWK